MHIDVTSCNMRQLIAKAYELSMPQGLGHLHYTPKPLGEGEIDAIIERSKNDTRYPIEMDYVNGRAVKLYVFRGDNGKLVIGDSWYDHTDAELDELCEAIGAVKPVRSAA